MNLDELRSVQSKERSKDSLQHLRESFYADVGEYICDLREERERAAERASDPFDSEEVNRLTDEIQTAEEVVEAIYERRVGKVVKRASLAAADMPADEEGLTAEEQELFADLVDRIESNKSTVLDVLAGDADGNSDEPSSEATDVTSTDDSPPGDDTSPSDAGAESDAARPSAEAAAIAGDSDASSASAGDEGDADGADGADGTDEADDDPLAGLSDRTTVRITSDVGEILGVDQRSYDLAEEDVVTLPAANAEPLLERDAAERLE